MPWFLIAFFRECLSSLSRSLQVLHLIYLWTFPVHLNLFSGSLLRVLWISPQPKWGQRDNVTLVRLIALVSFVSDFPPMGKNWDGNPSNS